MKIIFTMLAVLSLPCAASATVAFEFEQIVVREMHLKEIPARAVSLGSKRFLHIKETSEMGISFRLRSESNETPMGEFLGIHSFPLDFGVPQIWVFKDEEKEPFQYIVENMGPINEEEYAVLHNPYVSEVIRNVAVTYLGEQFPSLDLKGMMRVTNDHGPAECSFGDKGDLFCRRTIKSKFIYKSQQFEHMREKGIDPLDLLSAPSEGA